MGVNMQIITRGWVILRLSNDSPFALSLVMMAFALPVTFMSPIGGATADRISRKKIVMFTLMGNTVMTLVLAVLDITGFVRFWHLLVIGFINGSLMSFNMPSRQALLADIVPSDNLMNAVALHSSAMNVTRVLGPAVAGFLIIYLNTFGVFFLIGCIYFCSLLSLAFIRAGDSATVKHKNGLSGDIREGLSYVYNDPTLFGLIIMLFMPSLFGFSYLALLPAWAREVLNVQSDNLGILMMTMGLGSLIGSLLLASMRNFYRRGTLLIVVGLAWGIILVFFSQTTSYVTTVPTLLLTGLFSSVFMSLNMTLLQTYTAPHMRGRIMSLSMMTFGSTPLSAVPFGALAEKIGTPDALGLSGLMVIVFIGVFIIKYPSFRRIK